jgi:hypothetical protein
MSDQLKFITTCEADESGDLILTFPEELLEAMSWGEGTTIDWSVSPGTITLREVVLEAPTKGRKKWWVNSQGELKQQIESPGSDWQNGKKWKIAQPCCGKSKRV